MLACVGFCPAEGVFSRRRATKAPQRDDECIALAYGLVALGEVAI